MRRLAAVVVAALAAGCGTTDDGKRAAPPETPEPAGAGAWESPGYHISGVIPPGWTRHPSEESLVALSADGGEMALRVLVVDATFLRPDGQVLERVLEGRWTKVSTSRFDFLGASAVRGDFLSSDGLTASTHVLWEWNEGASPGRKFVFHATIVTSPQEHARLVRGFEEFVGGIRLDLLGPDVRVPELALSGGWTAKSLPRDRALEVAGCRIPAETDPFCDRSVPVAGWMDVRDRLREKRLQGGELTAEEAWRESLAHYNLALHMLWAQVGAPAEKREEARTSPLQYLQSFARMNAALAINAALVVKLRARRDARPWGDAARLQANATVLEALAVFLKTGELDAETRRGLLDAAGAPACDYRDLATAWWKELGAAETAAAVAATARGREALAARRLEDAEERAREALAATGGAWPEAHRLVAAAAFQSGRVANAAGAARSAVAALPRSANLLLEDAEILVAAGRPDEALAVLDGNDGLIRDSLPGHALVLEALRAMAWDRKGDGEGAKAAVEAVLKLWREGGGTPAEWDFGALGRAIGGAEPARGRLAALADLLGGRGTQEGLRAAWSLGR